jgi:hypothetical protein
MATPKAPCECNRRRRGLSGLRTIEGKRKLNAAESGRIFSFFLEEFIAFVFNNYKQIIKVKIQSVAAVI